MNKVKAKLITFLNSEEGLTTVEYAVAGGVIAAAVVTAFTGLGGAVAAQLGELITAITG